MTVVQMQKVAVLADKSFKEDLIEALHHEGVLEVREAENNTTPIDHTQVEFRVAELQFAIQTLQAVASKETLAASQKSTTEESILQAAKHTDVRGIIDTLHKLEEKDTIAEKELQECHTKIEQIQPWVGLPYNLQSAAETSTTVRIQGMLPTAKYEALESTLQKTLPRSSILRVQDHKGITTAVAHIWKTDVRTFEESATSLGWTTESLPALDGQAAEIVQSATMRIRELELQKQKNNEERTRLSVELPNLLKVATFMSWLDEKQSVRESMSETQSTITLLGWMPKKNIALIESRLQKISPAIVVLKVRADEGEEPPVLLKNHKWATPFQSVTTLYGLPLSSEFDPTASLAPFFALFFALCLTDAGYGIVLALIFGIVLLKTRKTAEESPLLWTLFIGGVATAIVGVLFGGWFGLTPDQVPQAFTVEATDGTKRFIGQLWSLSEKDGIMFLLYLSLVLGITHIFYGMFLAGLHKWLHGQKAAAFWVDFTSHLLLGTVLVYAATRHPYALYALYASLVIFVWGKGHGNAWYLRPVFGALGFVNFCINILSNGLSYLRILALGLVTGSLAGAVNQVAIALGNLFPLWVGIPVIIGIFLLGHLVSIALNTLGTFIHAGRLQFIEFFGQFFEGGGKPFSPFRRKI